MYYALKYIRFIKTEYLRIIIVYEEYVCWIGKIIVKRSYVTWHTNSSPKHKYNVITKVKMLYTVNNVIIIWTQLKLIYALPKMYYIITYCV